MRICVITYYCKMFKSGGGTWGTCLYTVSGVGSGMTHKRSVRRGSGAPSTDDPGAWQHLIGPDFPSIETRQLARGFQIGVFRPIRVDHTNCLQVAVKTHSFFILADA
jgi:hypothetical protein